MRIEQIHLLNLNSLEGEWQLDLTHPAFANEGIFAITGPTGAGKTTLLDALCLALYGRTPRLDKVTKGINEIMSRQSGECFAEVTFQSGTARYRCHWGQHRARKRADGELQLPRHEIVDADSGQVLESGLKAVAERVEQVTGMDFDRFVRTTLLAQGGFALFLQSPPAERAPVLEQITGTAIYSQISMQVHERRGEERGRLEQLNAALAALPEGDAARLATLRTELQQMGEEEAQLRQQQQRLQEILQWLDGIAALEQELQEQQRQHADWQQRAQHFQSQRQRLQRAWQALELAADHARLQGLRLQQQSERAEHDSCRHQLHGLESAARETDQQHRLALANLARGKEQYNIAQPELRRARELDLRLRERRRPIDEQEQRLLQQDQELRRLRTEQAETQQQLDVRCQELRTLQAQLSRQTADGRLVDQLAGISRRLAALKQQQGEQQERLQALACEREQLREGEPCPLCGSIHHPYALGSAATASTGGWRTPSASNALLVAMQRELEPFAVQLSGLEQLDEVERTLLARRDAWLQQQEQRARLEQGVVELEQHKGQLEDTIGRLQREWEQQAQHQLRLQTEWEGLVRQRQTLYGDLAPDAEEVRLIQEVERVERAEQSVRGLRDEAQRGLEQVRARSGELERSLVARTQQIARAETGFRARLASTPFADEQEYLLAALDEEERNRLAEEERVLAAQQAALEPQMASLMARLQQARGQALSHEARPELQRDDCAERLRALQQQMGAVQQQLRDGELQSQRRGELEQAMALQRPQWLHWEQLHELIGSADGKRFRNFAQGLTFARLVREANRQLRSMTDRYLLIQDETQSLELNVVDNYQAGLLRSTKNLSGGEGFLVSLALALGLSNMAGDHVRVDSLFLDEGFGTLDAEALDQALETLAGLQREGRLIGIISHVAALKERIGCRIEVIPQSGGRSQLLGPGCRRLR